MDIFSDLSFTDELTKLNSLEEIFEQPHSTRLNTGDHRFDESNVFFETKNNKLAFEFKQVKLSKTKSLPAAMQQKAQKEQKLINDLAVFFNKYPFVSLNNFRSAEKVFTNYFKISENLYERIINLKALIEKINRSSNSKFGDIFLSLKLQPCSIKMTLERSKMQGVKQYIQLNLKDDLNPLLIYTQWNWKNKKYEMIRSRSKLNRPRNESKNAIEFDAKIWQAFNVAGIKPKHFIKTLDCIERNQNTLIRFINQVNKKSLVNIFEDNLITNVSIKTDNQDTTFVNFRTNNSQKIEVHMTSFASSLVVS